MSAQASKLFSLLPALHRLRDARVAQSQQLLTAAETARLQQLRAIHPPLTPAQQAELDQITAKAARGPLESLLMLIDEQIAVVAENLDQLYDDQFIETCAPWVIPYIGDLIGYQTVHGVAAAVASPRAEVAHTISFRRRKGTVLALEQLARDVTGWGAHAVEFFKLLADTQYLNHVRADNAYAPDLRDWKVGAYMNTGFDATAHTVDVRRIDVERGRYNIQNAGIFLWSLNAYSLTMSAAAPVSGSAQCFRFNPLGRDVPLFHNPVFQGASITAPAQPQNVPAILLRRELCEDIRQIAGAGAAAVYYGMGNSLALYLSGALVDASKIQVCDLSGEDPNWNNVPSANSAYAAAIDPELGRIALPPGSAQTVQADLHYGFNADMSGGEYSRESTFSASPEQTVVRVPGDYQTIHDALVALGGDGVVEITDSALYREDAGLNIALNAHGHIELRAAEGARPVLFLGDAISVTGGEEAAFDLNGVVVAYAPPSTATPLPPALLHAPAGGSNQLRHLGMTHCTLVPGWALTPSGKPLPAYAGLPTLLAETSGLQVVIDKSIAGRLWIGGLASAQISDSIVDATDPTGVAYAATIDSAGRPQAGGALSLRGCTVIGKVYARLLSLISNSIVSSALSPADTAATPPLWAAPLWASRRQEGCVRFSYVPAGSAIPRQFECVDQAVGSPQLLFYSLRYGDPGYAKLAPSTADAIRRGADDGGEMGAFHFVLAPLRETDLRVRIQEYLPVNLELGVFYEN
ncbi:MAG TPA: hypothetical protein VMG35_15635 [Bryobacteraceae bacterium]|nr:hypothetical protein [Bryobacteraceae bacterium]